MKPPSDMSAAAWARIGKLPPDTRDRVLERAAILITHAGLTPAEADKRSLFLEAGISQQVLP